MANSSVILLDTLLVQKLMGSTFTRDAKAINEREQALRLLRAIIVLPLPKPGDRPSSRRDGHSRTGSRQGNPYSANGYGTELCAETLKRKVALTDGMVRALVSIAENPDDPMRIICMETLIEIGMSHTLHCIALTRIGVMDLECLVRSDAFRTVLLVFKDGPMELGPSVTGLLLHLVNQPETRRYILRGSDVEVSSSTQSDIAKTAELTWQTVLVGLTEEYGKVSKSQQSRHAERLHLCIRNVGMVLGSWTG